MQIFKSMCYSRYYIEVTELYVNEKYRRSGIATKMFEYIEEYFKDKNIVGYQLFTGKNNTVAQLFYEKRGYVKSDEIMYRKRLNKTDRHIKTICQRTIQCIFTHLKPIGYIKLSVRVRSNLHIQTSITTRL